MIALSLILFSIIVPQQSTFDTYATKDFDKSSIAKAYERWDKFATVKNFPVFIVSKDDGAFVSSNLERLAPGHNCKNLANNPSSSAVCWNKDGKGAMILSSYTYQTVEHEAVHIAQLATIGKNISLAPCWFIEGQAVYMSGNNSYRQTALSIFKQIQNSLNTKTSIQWQDLIKNREVRDQKCNEFNYNYGVGYLIVEKLYNDYGFDKVAKFMVTMGGKPWKEAFYESFEISSDEWYSSSVGPYLEKINV
jgi:hypothetical protein